MDGGSSSNDDPAPPRAPLLAGWLTDYDYDYDNNDYDYDYDNNDPAP